MAERILMNEFKQLSKPGENPWVNIQLGKGDDLFKWDVALIVTNTDSLYYGGYFKAELKFPQNYPYSPPEFRFLRPLYHPNIYPDGKLCISILHPPGDDEMSGELASERWSPAQRVESVLISIISLLDDAEVSSAANVDAGVMFRKDLAEYKRLVAADVEQSKKDIPADYIMPTSAELKPPPKDDDCQDFWYDSGAESFEGSEDGSVDGSDAEMTFDEDEDDDDTEDDDVEEVKEADANFTSANDVTPLKNKNVVNVATASHDNSRTTTPRPRE